MSWVTLAALLAGSGLAALVYETLWVKQLTLVVGVDVYAVTTVVSAFFAGLASGSAALGARADRSPRPLALYAALEGGTAVLALGTTLALGHLAPLYVRLGDVAGRLAWLLPFILVAAPAFLMGGTLPAMMRAADPGADRIGGTSGWLYAINTAGGVVGTLATALLLVPALGVRGTGLAAVALSAGLAAIAALLARRAPPPQARDAAPAADRPPAAHLALVLYAVAGAVALGYEVLWTQALVQFLDTTALAFAIVLATYLAGLVAGSAAWAAVADRVQRPWVAFGLLELGAGALALGTFAALGPWLPAAQEALAGRVATWTGSTGLGVGARLVLPAVTLLLGPVLLLGAAFPAAARLACGPRHASRDLGSVTALNTLGGIAGTCLTGFVLLPLAGIVRTLAILTVIAAAIGAVALVRGATRRPLAAAGGVAAVLAVAIAGLAVPPDHLARVLVATRGGELETYEESPGGTVAVLREPHQPAPFRRLYIDGVSNSSDSLMSLRYMRLQALLPLLVHDGPNRSALVVGLGTGITCGTLLAWPSLERRVCVELLPAVVRATRRFQGNFGPADDPRIDLRLADGRHELLRHDDRYDVITLEPPPPTAAGIVNLYSRDFYLLCRERLAPHGLMAQWWPLASQNDEESRSIVRAFLDAFPYATLWTTELHEMLLLGSPDPIVFDVPTITARFDEPTVRDALAQVGVPDVAALLGTFVTGRDGLATYAGDAPAVTDDRPTIEHASLQRPYEFSRVIGHIFASRAEPPLAQADETFVAALHARRLRLLTFYQASLHWYAGEMDKVEPLLQKVLAEEGDNPYFRWFLGSS